jgi:hypothetical protein
VRPDAWKRSNEEFIEMEKETVWLKRLLEAGDVWYYMLLAASNKLRILEEVEIDLGYIAKRCPASFAEIRGAMIAKFECRIAHGKGEGHEEREEAAVAQWLIANGFVVREY